jgi:BON domain-containing protein
MTRTIVMALTIAGSIVSLTSCVDKGPPPGDQGKTPKAGMGGSIRDVEITSLVERRLAADSLTSSANIKVKTEQGVVTLTGEVDNEETKRKAQEVAKAVLGVNEVRNGITVGKGPIEPKKPGGPRKVSKASRPINANKSAGTRIPKD